MSESPDLVQPIIGFRGWNIADGLKLTSAGVGMYVWKPGVNEASCVGYDLTGPTALTVFASSMVDVSANSPEPHPAPQRNCGCGLYAYRDVPATEHRGPSLIGAVVAWGKVEMHRSGWRAEKAMIVALGIPNEAANDPDLRLRIDLLASQYRCRAVPICDLRIEARKHGIETPEELLPEALKPPRERVRPGWLCRGSTGCGADAAGNAAVGISDEPDPAGIQRHTGATEADETLAELEAELRAGDGREPGRQRSALSRRRREPVDQDRGRSRIGRGAPDAALPSGAAAALRSAAL